MKLRGRNLFSVTPPLTGADVKLLQSELQQLGYAIPADEVAPGSFGQGTQQAVLQFQTTHGLETTGVVDERTALLINRAVDALHPQPEPSLLLVNGSITDQEARPLRALIVRAFERGMRSEGLLGEEQTDATGHYQISYTARQIQHAEEGPPDLMIRVFSPDGRVLGASPTVFDAPPVAVIDLKIPISQQGRLSEYEETLGEITPILEGVALADLTDDDIAFLFGETRIDPQRLEFVRQAAKLSRQTEIQTEAFYGWARENIPLMLEQLLALPNADLRAALKKAIDANIIPAGLRQSLDQVMARVGALRSVPASPTLSELVSTLHLEVPAQLSSFLAKNGINTLTDIRTAGGISQLVGLPVAPDDAIVRTLDAHAYLSELSSDIMLNSKLIDHGYDSLRGIADARRQEFVKAAGDSTGTFKAAQLQFRAQAGTAALDNLRTEFFVANTNQPNGRPKTPIAPAVCRCDDCEAAVSPLAYLVDLLNFTTKRIVDDQNSISLQSLTDMLHQPFGDLIASCDAVTFPIRQVRICIEVLRSVLGQTVVDDSGYRQAAYLALLDRLGVSYERIRIAHTASKGERQALADLLGIDLSDNRPDNLDALLFDLAKPEQPAEKELNDLIGLPDTHVVALVPPQADPAFLAWRLKHLQTQWADAPLAGMPVIDPDLIDSLDFKNPVNANPAYTLWQARTAALAKKDGDWRAQVGNQSGNIDGLIQTALGVSAASLVALANLRDSGQDIRTQLAALDLDRSAFDRLMDLRTFIGSGAKVLDGEWDEFYGILLQAWKQQQFATWIQEETQQKIFLSPDLFQIPFTSETTTPQPTFVFKPWRGSLSARRAWQDVLRARIDQDQAVRDGFAAAVDATEEATLGKLRDVLLDATDVADSDFDKKAHQYNSQYFIDAKMSTCHKTTRVSQAIDTVQGLIFAVRNGQLLGQSNLQIDSQYQLTFDEEWRWMGSYSTWRAAMLVFLYPENVLAPTLRRPDRQTPAFVTLTNQVRANQALTPMQACQAAAQYSDYFRDVCQLAVEASCLASTPVSRGDCLHHPASLSERILLYLFARSWRGQVYFSSFDPNDATGFGQSFWDRVPGLNATMQLLGAVPYEAVPGKRFICVFAIALQGGNRILACTKYDLTKQTWDAEPLYLEPPAGAGAFTAAVKQSASDAQPPHLVVRLENGAVMNRRMNGDVSDWETNQWLTLVDASSQSITGISAMIADDRTLDGRDLDPNGFFVFGTLGQSTLYKYLKLFSVPLFRLSKDGTDLYTSKAALRDDSVQHQGYKFSGIEGYIASPDIPQPDGMYPLYHFADSQGQHWYTTDNKQLGVKDYGIEGYVPIDPEQGKVNRPGMVGFYQLYNTNDHTLVNTSDSQRIADVKKTGTVQDWALTRLGYIIDAKWLELAPRNSDFDPYGNWLGGFSWGVDAVVYAFYEQGGATKYVQLRRDGSRSASVILAGPDGIVTHCGAGSNPNTQYVAQQPQDAGTAPYQSVVTKDSGVTFTLGQSLAPLVGPDGPFEITEDLSEAGLQARVKPMITAFNDTEWDPPSSNLVYLQEAYYFVPVTLAMALQAAGQYTAALDWYRTVYDYSAVAPGKRNIYYGFELEKQEPFVFQRLPDWLEDPLNPHAIAETRRGCYLRFTLISLVRCLLDFADSEFTRDTSESVERARLLYLTALDLLAVNQLNQTVNQCPNMIGTVELGVPDQFLNIANDVNQEAELINDMALYQDTAAKVQVVLSGNSPWNLRLQQAREIVAAAKAGSPPPPTIGNLLERRAGQLVQTDRYLLAQPEIGKAVDQLTAVAGQDFAQAVSSVSGYSVTQLENQPINLPWLSGSGAGVGTESMLAAGVGRGQPSGNTGPRFIADTIRQNGNAGAQVAQGTKKFVPDLSQQFCVPPNPILLALQAHVEVCLFKLRHCRNIAGFERQLDPYSAPTDIRSNLPMIGVSGKLSLPGTVNFQPTPYRYSMLIERAKQLVAQAQQLETVYFSALEKRDVEAYSLLKARQDLQVTRASVRLQDLRAVEAQGGVSLAKLQQQRQQDQVDHYTQLISQGTSGLETAALVLQVAGVVHLHAHAAITEAETFGLGGIGEVGSALIATAAAMQVQAGYDRRMQEWQFQKTIALDEARIGAQQTLLAEDHLRVAGQERQIAQLQSDHAAAIVDFLSNKFTNIELYDWMSSVLGDAYRYFLQQATSVALAATHQLAFERQEPPPSFVQNDYWDVSSAGGTNTGNGNAPDRRGLTGSARLLTDIYQLDQYAFETNKRKLQLSKPISLAQLAPAEFQGFRETGVMRFSTPMQMFDRELPGHYLRLTRRVKTSVIALIPPIFGIRASLSTSGVSRAVIGAGFQKVTVRREPQEVVLSSPRDATGLFVDLDVQSDMLLPFEGLGVDTDWELRMPKAANLFDYNTIADVLLTIDYTALDSFDYRTQLLQSQDFVAPLISDRPFSFRYQFADQWYDLHNPDQTAKPMVVSFTTSREDFPPNLDGLKITQVVLYFARSDGQTFEVKDAQLQFTPNEGGGPLRGKATSFDGVISTRRGNAVSWMPMTGHTPFGDWELDLTSDPSVRDHIQKEDVVDILFVITFSGRTPDWPN